MSKDRKEYMREWRKKNRKRLAENQAKWRVANPERSLEINRKAAAKRDPDVERERVREWKRANKDKTRRQQRRDRTRHPFKDLARQLLSSALRRGDVVKPECCEQCGIKIDRRGLHGHHEDYLKPLEIRWLCQRCHHKVHQNVRIEGLTSTF